MFVSVLDLCFLHGLPLHIARSVCATRAKRLDVVNDVARARPARLAGQGTRVSLDEAGALVRVAFAVGSNALVAEGNRQDGEQGDGYTHALS